MRGRVLLPIVGVVLWGGLGAAACSATKDDPGLGNGKGGQSNAGTGGISLGGTPAGGSGIRPPLGGENVGGSMMPLPPHTACTPEMPCGGMLACVKGAGEPDHCAPVGAECTTDTDCGGDSYCCGEGCLTAAGPSVCIPYGYGPRGNVNEECKGEGAPPGVFAPSLQCEWKVKTSDAHPSSGLVLATPMVADLPNDSGPSAEIVFVSYAKEDGDQYASVSTPGVIRIINGQTCELVETVEPSSGIIRAGSPLALADVNGDGTIEILGRKDKGGLIAFTWDMATSKYVKMWESAGTIVNQPWDGPSIHDLNDDGVPEALVWGAVVNAVTGAPVTDFTLSQGFNGYLPVAGDFNGDGKVDLAASFGAEATYLSFIGNAWVDQALLGDRWNNFGSHFAVADFGTPGATPADFNPAMLDGIAEVVATNAEAAAGRVSIYTLTGQEVMSVITTPDALPGVTYEGGGPPTIGDFDNDGFPEVAIAGATRFRVFDFDCRDGGAGCEGPFVRWSQKSQDASSRQTAASIFDFDGDGKAEAVYADECFLRVYDGTNGDVLFSSYRTSGTWLENPVIADVDKDDNTEIIVNSASYVGCPASDPMPMGKAFVDPLHKGARCDDDMGCVAGATCGDGYCRCTAPTQCDEGSTCVPPLAGTPGTGNVCRATHPNTPATAGGVRVLRDRLDRWASSRPLWNQHAYSITNVLDDGKIPKTSEWLANWKQPKLNNYRANVQGATGFADYPDITGALSEDKVCVQSAEGGVTLTATVCNRGKKAVGADMPATFYKGEASAGEILCVSYTKGPVPVGGCADVSCEVQGVVSGIVTMVVNDDGKGNKTTVECNSDNNTDFLNVKKCEVPK